MALFRNNLNIVEARQLIGTATETMDVIEWIRNRGGYPWLMGNAYHPETLVPEGSDEVGGEGVYLDPTTGALVIHTKEGDIWASYGQFVLCKSDNKFEVWDAAQFLANFDPA
jgi:hypothetical protein